MATVEDSELVQLAAGRSAELFPVFRRVSSFGPLIVLLAFVPGLYALVVNPVLRDSGALWGLKAINVLQADSMETALDASGEGELRWQNPLGAWLTALAMRVMGPSQRLGLVIVGYLAHAAAVGSCFVLFRRLFDARIGFWVALMLACHAPFLHQVQDPVPGGLGLWLALLAFWAFLLHVDEAGGVVSWYLLAGGVALGLCLISGGPLALAVTVILLLYVLGLRGQQVETRRAETVVRRRLWVGRSALKSLSALLLTAFAVGGWWVLMMSSRYGAEFRSGWLTGRAGGEAVGMASYLRLVEWLSGQAARLFDEFGLLSGFVLLGIWYAARELFRTNDESRRRPLEFVVAWGGVAFLIWQAALRAGSATAAVGMWESFFLIPFIALAALGIAEISARRFAVWQVSALVTVTMLAYLVRDTGFAGSVPFLLAVATLCAGGAVGWGLQKWCQDRDSRSRAVLSALVVGPVLLNGWFGLISSRPVGERPPVVQTFAEGVADVEDIGVCIILSDKRPSPQVRFAARSLWPQARLMLVEQWEHAVDLVLAESEATRRPVVLVDWGSHEARLTNLRFDSVDVEQIPQPRRLRSQELKTYLFKPR